MAEFSKKQQDAAYRAAEQAIEEARAAAATELTLSARRVNRSDSGPRVVETGFAGLTRLPEQIGTLTSLQTLRLDGTQVSDLAPLATLTDLQNLSLYETQVSDIAPIATLTGLQVLWLNGTQVSDLAPLAALTGLETLWLSETKVSDLAALATMTELQTLWLSETQVSDLGPLAALTGLQMLMLNETPVSDLAPLAALTGLQILWLNETQVSYLAPLSAMTGLQDLRLNETQVSDLAPLASLTALKTLSLNQTAVADLSPLTKLTSLQSLDLHGSQATDLRPLRLIAGLTEEVTNALVFKFGLRFSDTPATARDAELARLSGIEDNESRTRETLAYLATLPPWPEPLEPTDYPILTVEALLKSQSPLGWRFSPTDGAMQVYAEAAPTTAMQEQLAKMSGERAQALRKALAGANHGLRGEALQEASRFADLMDDGSRPLSVRSVELWGSLVALGGLLDGNDVGRVQGRDPLDLLSVEQRAALQTLLQIAGNFVRSFPDVKALDDSAGGFLRRSITVEMVGAMIEAALRAAYVTPGSAALMQHVAAIGGTEGAQADKAASVSVRGIANLIQTAALFVGKGSIKLAGAAALGAAGYVGKEAADHYDLDKAAFAYVELIRDKVGPFLSNMQPDEAAVLQSALNDAEMRLNERARQNMSENSLRPKLEQGRDRSDRPSTDLKKS